MKAELKNNIARIVAEFIATAIFLFLGCMGCIKTETIPNTHLQAIFNFGLVVMISLQVVGCITGGNINPAVTLAAFFYDHVTLPMAACYFVAQMLGATLGYGLLIALVSSEATPKGFCVTHVHADINLAQAFFIEFFITSILIMVCCGVWDPRNAGQRDAVPLKFGLAVSALACSAAPWTGASMNPVRTFGPAIWSMDFKDHWIYWVAPMSSSLVTVLAYKSILWRDPKAEQGEE